MSTAKQVIQSAARAIGVKRQGVDLSDDELQDATDMLREMLLEWQADGIKIPFTIPFLPTDELGEIDWTTSYIKLATAMRLAINYAVEPTPNLYAQYKDARRAVFGRLTELGPMQKPSTLPVGSGNQWFGSSDRRFYPNVDKVAIATGSDNTLIDSEGETITRQDERKSIIGGRN